MNLFKIIILIILFCSCSQKQTDLDYEKKVMDEIFIDLINLLYDDPATGPFISRPPPPGGYKSEEHRKNTLLEIEKHRKEFELNKLRIQNDTSRVLIIVFDTIYKTVNENKEFHYKDMKNVVFLNDTASNNSAYVIDHSLFAKNEKYLFDYRSNYAYPNGRPFFRALRANPPLNHFGAVVNFSRISFDKERNHGVLSAGISHGPLDGYGCRIYLKKENEKWVIDKIALTSIS